MVKYGMKTCTHCGIEKELSDFYKCRDGYQYRCKSCHLERLKTPEYKKWAAGNAATTRNKEIQDRWRKSPAGIKAVRGYALKRNFGIDQVKYEYILKRQDGACAICSEKSSKNLHVDHCHKNNKIRGLLCGPCNRMLGMAKDKIHVLNSAVDYLDRNR